MSKKKIVAMTGGGSGGHLTPLIAVAEQFNKLSPDYDIAYIGQTGDKLGDIMHDHPDLFVSVKTVRAGKLRRYHGEGMKQLLDIKTLLLNIRDMLYVAVGFVQALLLLRRLRPKVLFCKGGFVGVPVAWAAWLLRIPYVTHDSDVIPGLANRIISKGATLHAVAMPKELYRYPAHKTVTVGVPIAARFKRATDTVKAQARESLGLPKKAAVVLVVGGGLGAVRINEAIMSGVKDILKQPDVHLLHVVGRDNEQTANEQYDKKLTPVDRKRVTVYGFTNKVALLGEAADIVVTRAGATALAEFSTQGKPCIIVPNPYLTSGHQIKNAHAYKEKQAAVVVAEDHVDELPHIIDLLLHNPQKQQELSDNISSFSTKDSAQLLANLLLTAAEKQ